MTLSKEKVLQDKCIGWLKNQPDIWYMKTCANGIQKAGVPDLIICAKGKFLAIELKRDDGKGVVHPRQQININQINNAKGIACVCDDFERFKTIVNETKGTL